MSDEDFFSLTRRLSREMREQNNAVQRCVFNVLMNNRDDHSKNISFVMEGDGTWKLAPPYDLTYCPGYRGEHFMDVAGEGRAPNREHVLKAAKSAGMATADAAKAIDELLACMTPDLLKSLASELPLERKTVTTVHEAMQTNYARLSGARRA